MKEAHTFSQERQEAIEKLEAWCTVRGKARWGSCGENCRFLKRQNMELPSDPGIPLYKNLCTNVYSIIIHSSHNVEINADQGIEHTQNVVPPHTGALLSPEKGWNPDTCYNMDGPWEYDAQWEKTDAEGHLVYKPLMGNIPESGFLVVRGWGGDEGDWPRGLGSFSDNENVLRLFNGDGCKTVNIRKIVKWYSLIE